MDRFDHNEPHDHEHGDEDEGEEVRAMCTMASSGVHLFLTASERLLARCILRATA